MQKDEKNSSSSHLQIGTTSTTVKMSPENLLFAFLDYYKCFFFTRKVCIRQPLTRLIWEITRKIWKSFVTVVQCKSRSRRGLDDKTIVFQCQIDKVVMFLSLSSSWLFKRAKKCISNDSASCSRNVFHLFDKEVSNERVHSCVTNE